MQGLLCTFSQKTRKIKIKKPNYQSYSPTVSGKGLRQLTFHISIFSSKPCKVRD